MSQQLLLSVQLQDRYSFDNFLLTEQQQVVDCLQQMAKGSGEHYVYLWGSAGVGKSHLLQSCCSSANKLGFAAIYLPLRDEFANLSPAILESLEQYDLVCIDDIEVIADSAEWQEAMMHLYNRIKDLGKCLVISGFCNANQLNIELADLRSRLSWGLSFRLEALSDSEKIAALCLRAKYRGLVLSQEVAEFLLRRCPRNMKELFAALDKLDKASLEAQRRLTIPFVKDVLAV